MKSTLKFALATALLAAAGTSFAACEAPAQPSAIDGASSTMDDMVAKQGEVKAFQAANTEYLACLEGELNGAKAAAVEGDDAAKAKFATLTDAYNAGVAAEEAVAGGFNDAIKAYKAANK